MVNYLKGVYVPTCYASRYLCKTGQSGGYAVTVACTRPLSKTLITYLMRLYCRGIVCVQYE